MKARATKDWTGVHVLVTGAAGFIGSHLVERLILEGARVSAFVRYTSNANIGLLRQLPPRVRERVQFIYGDLRDGDAISNAMAGADLVFHLGAIISIPYSYVHPRETVETNFMGTFNVLQACHQHNVQRLIHTSSSEVYGSALTIPMDEQHPLQGQSPYSASKIGADKLVESFYRSFNLSAVTIRPFNTYGPRQSARAVIPTIITQALTQDEVRLGNLEARRDFTYVEDVVAAFLLAAEAKGVVGQVFNLGVGKDISVGRLAREIIQQIGRKVSITSEAMRLRPELSEVDLLRSDNTRAADALGWIPDHDLHQGLTKTIEWVRENLDFYQVGRYQI